MQKPGTDLVVGSWSSDPIDQQMVTSGTADPEQWLVEAIGGRETYSGVEVNEGTVLTSGPVYQAITLISSDLASLPIQVIEDRGGQKRQRPDHAIAQIWNHKGNEEMLPYAVRQYLIAQSLIYGNGIGVIHFQMGVPVGVYPIATRCITLDRIMERDDMPGHPTGELIYRYHTSSGQGILFPHEVFHFKIMGTALWGYSPLGLFNNTFGNGLAYEKYQGKHFSNDARPSGVLQNPGRLSPDARSNLRREWDEIHQGLDNTSRIALLQQGTTWSPMSVSNKDAEMIDSRKFYREEVAAIYNIPQHKLGAMENSAVRANIEEQNRDYVQHTLSPHDRSWSQESIRKLTNPTEQRQQRLSSKHNFKALLRGDLKSRYDSFSVGRQWGWLSANDVLKIEDMDEIGEQGDIYLVPSNMADAETGEPFTATQAAPETISEPVPESEALLAFARQTLLETQATEIKAVRRAMKSTRKPFLEGCQRYYSTFAGYMEVPLRALAHVDGFRDELGIRTAVETYAAESITQLQDVTSDDELLRVVVKWPDRIDVVLDTIQEGIER